MIKYNFEISNNKLISYIEDYLYNKKIEGDIYKQDNKAVVEIDCDDCTFKTLIAEIILNFYKFELLFKTINFGKEPSLPECAFLGAVMSLEKSIEIEKIIIIADKTEVKNIEGFFNFCLCSMHDNWENLAILSKKLLSQCQCEKDIYSLTGFMLGIDDNAKNNLVVDFPLIFRGCDNEPVEVMNYFVEPEKNIILAILAQNPSDILVLDSQKVSKNFMQVIQSLGE